MTSQQTYGQVTENNPNRLSEAPTEIRPVKEYHIDVSVIEQLENVLHSIKQGSYASGSDSPGQLKKQPSLRPRTSHHDHLANVRGRIGLEKEAPLDEEHVDLNHHELVWSRIRYVFREPFAEFWG